VKRVLWWLLLLALIPLMAQAGTVRLRWTNPTTNADTLDCRLDGSTPLTDFGGTKWWAVRFKDPSDTLYMGQLGATIDSADFVFADSVTMGELLCKTTDTHNNDNCVFSHYVFALPLPPEPVAPPPGGGLLGEYYRGVKTSAFSQLVATRVDSTVNFSWGSASPMAMLPADSFTVRWTGYVYIPTAGDYTFYVSSDDGFKWWIDGILFDWWGPTFEQEITTGVKTLTAGLHPVKLEYMELNEVAACHLKYSGPGISKRVVPANVLSH
jgi:PA14 domain